MAKIYVYDVNVATNDSELAANIGYSDYWVTINYPWQQYQEQLFGTSWYIVTIVDRSYFDPPAPPIEPIDPEPQPLPWPPYGPPYPGPDAPWFMEPPFGPFPEPDPRLVDEFVAARQIDPVSAGLLIAAEELAEAAAAEAAVGTLADFTVEALMTEGSAASAIARLNAASVGYARALAAAQRASQALDSIAGMALSENAAAYVATLRANIAAVATYYNTVFSPWFDRLGRTIDRFNIEIARFQFTGQRLDQFLRNSMDWYDLAQQARIDFDFATRDAAASFSNNARAQLDLWRWYFQQGQYGEVYDTTVSIITVMLDWIDEAVR